MSDKKCPCGTERAYTACCGRYISGEAFPETAEALMRSRYTAYTQANMDYIEATMRDKALEGFNRESALEWAKKNKWTKLNVLEAFPHETDENIAYVKFTAYYLRDEKLHQLNETSEFKRIDGRWFYMGRI